MDVESFHHLSVDNPWLSLAANSGFVFRLYWPDINQFHAVRKYLVDTVHWGQYLVWWMVGVPNTGTTWCKVDDKPDLPVHLPSPQFGFWEESGWDSCSHRGGKFIRWQAVGSSWCWIVQAWTTRWQRSLYPFPGTKNYPCNGQHLRNVIEWYTGSLWWQHAAENYAGSAYTLSLKCY